MAGGMVNLNARRQKNSSNFRFKFWEDENHLELLVSEMMFNQRLNASIGML